MLRIAAAATVVAGLAAFSTPPAVAQDGVRVGAGEALSRVITRRGLALEPGQDAAALGAGGAVTPRLAIEPGDGQSASQNEQLGDRQIVVEPPVGDPDDRRRPVIAVTPGGEQATPDIDQPGVQQVVIPPGGPDGAPPAGQGPNGDGGGAQQVVIVPDEALPDIPDAGAVVAQPPAIIVPQVRPGQPPGGEAPLVDAAAAGAGEPAGAVADSPAPDLVLPGGETLQAWQIQFRLGQAGYRDVRFLDVDDDYYYVIAAKREDLATRYVMAVDAYTGAVSAYQVMAAYSAPRYEEPAIADPRYQVEPRYEPRFEPPRYDYRDEPRYEVPRYEGGRRY